MLPSSLLAFVSAVAVTYASPIHRRQCNSTIPAPADPPTPPATPASSTSSTPTSSASTTPAVSPTLPSTGGETQLPSPSGTVKQIVVGHGIQNYTCTAAGANATSAGALAVLWDVQGLYPGMSPDSLPEAEWTGLPPKVLRTTDIPLNLLSTDGSQYAADPAAPFPPDADLVVEGIAAPLKFMGHHYFDATSTPTFDLYASPGQEKFLGKKDNAVHPPADADPGLTNSGAVDWLQLGNKGPSSGVTVVYRVVTAGGNPAPCTAAGQTDSVPYTAMYWFYE